MDTLQSGDSVSRVLPVKKAGENKYQISFENELSFQPDSLVNTTRRVLASDAGASDYIVNVLNCGNSSVAYGCAISRNPKDDIIACLGRKQPKACYLIDIKFQSTKTNTAKYAYLLGSLALFAFVGFIFLKPGRPRNVLPENQPTAPPIIYQTRASVWPHVTLGSVLFDAQNRSLWSMKKQ